MSLATTEESLRVTLLEQSATESSNACAFESVVESLVGDSDRLSRQVEVAVAVETLIEQGDVERNTETTGSERLFLTASGNQQAQRERETLADTEISVVGESESRQMTVGAVAAELSQSVVNVASSCAEDGTYYLEEQVTEEGIINREAEQETWDSILERYRTNSGGGLVLIEGVGGIGKTTLAEALLEETGGETTVHRARCQQEGNEPYQPIRDVLEDVETERDPFSSIGPADVPSVATEVGDAEAYEAQRTALFYDITELLRPDTEQAVLFLDDIGRADSATLTYLEYLTEQLSELPLVVLGTHRPGTIASDSPLAESQHPPNLEFTHFELDPFDRKETKVLIEQVVGRRGAPESFVDAVYDRTNGTPMFVRSTVETLLESDQLHPQFDWYPETAAEIDLPSAVHETVSQRINTLDDRSREILRWVALSSEAVEPGVLTRLLDGSRDQVKRSIEILSEAAVLDKPAEGEAVTLQSNVVREALQQELEDEQRRHRLLAAAMEAATVPDELEEADRTDVSSRETEETSLEYTSTIAYHFEQGGESELAIEWYEKAATRAQDVYAHEVAVNYYHRILDNARDEDREKVLTAGEDLADIHYTLGDYEEANQYVQFVRERVDDGDTVRRQRLAGFVAALASAQTDFERARTEIANGLELDGTPTEERCNLLLAKARHDIAVYEIEAAREAIAEARNIAEGLEDDHLLAQCIAAEGGIAEAISEYERARETLQSAIDTFEKGDNQRSVAFIQNSLGRIARKQGKFDDARSYHEAAIDVFEEIGARHVIGHTHNNLGLVAWRKSEYEKAREHYRKAIDTSRQLQDEYGVALGQLNLANVVREQGEYSRAETLYDKAFPVFDETDSEHLIAITSHDMGKLANRRGEYERAREYCQQALATYEKIGHEHHAGAVRNVLGLVSTRLGEYETALKHFDSALELATEIDNEALIGKVHANWAILSVECGNIARAISHGETALESLEDARNQWFLGRIHLTLGEVALSRGNLAQAEERTDRAAQSFESVTARHGTALTRAMRGQIASERNAHSAARASYEDALQTLTEIGACGDALAVLKTWCQLEQAVETGTPVEDLVHEAFEILEATESGVLEEQRQWFESQLDEPPTE